MILGFTGTRQGITTRQNEILAYEIAARRPRKFLNGGAQGADESALDIAFLEPYPSCVIIEIFPCDEFRAAYWHKRKNEAFLAGKDCLVRPMMKPLMRNKIIAEDCDYLIACPAEATEKLRSGTWATIRYARAAKKPITLILPSGEVIQE